jgi:hypothetical protein
MNCELTNEMDQFKVYIFYLIDIEWKNIFIKTRKKKFFLFIVISKNWKNRNFLFLWQYL